MACRAAAAIALAILLDACASTGPVAEALLTPAQDVITTGRVVFEQRENGIRVVAHVAGLGAGTYGMHLHEKADCSVAVDTRVPALSMAKSDAYGNAKFDAVVPGLTLQGDKSIAGKVVTVRTAPGPHLACGVVVKQ